MRYNRKKNQIEDCMTESPIANCMPLSQTCTMKPIILNVSKKILNRESIFRQPSHPATDELKKQWKLTDSQVLNSQIYNRLQERIVELETTEEEELAEHEYNMKIMDRLIEIGKEKIHRLKYEAWELRTETMELDQILQEEIEIHQELQMNWGSESDPEESESLVSEGSCSGESTNRRGCSIKNLVSGESQLNIEGSLSEPIVSAYSA